MSLLLTRALEKKTKSPLQTTKVVSVRRTSNAWSTMPKSTRRRMTSRGTESARNGLESYAYNLKSTVEDDKVKDKISDEDKKAVLDKAKEALDWVENNQTAEKDEYEYQQKELEKVAMPIMTKLAQAGGAPDMGGMGGMPSGFPGAGGAGAPPPPSSDGGAGPTIEEVD